MRGKKGNSPQTPFIILTGSSMVCLRNHPPTQPFRVAHLLIGQEGSQTLGGFQTPSSTHRGGVEEGELQKQLLRDSARMKG